MPDTPATSVPPVHELVPTADLEAWPLAADQVVEGDPLARGRLLWKSADSKLAAGIWECSPGVFDWVHADETACVVSGRALVTVGSQVPLELGPGSVVFFPKGTKSRWHVQETIRKAFHLHSDAGLAL
ncbi:MAG TPA: cupin domain-containing protein [Gaiellaceae bacterium]|nr:cupin domain-containing protein [Gaiellaceae bacterium]